jgi:hypothetical protein
LRDELVLEQLQMRSNLAREIGFGTTGAESGNQSMQKSPDLNHT